MGLRIKDHLCTVRYDALHSVIYPDEALWNRLNEKAAMFDLLANLRVSSDSAGPNDVWDRPEQRTATSLAVFRLVTLHSEMSAVAQVRVHVPPLTSLELRDA
jgi:hypothetical protein